MTKLNFYFFGEEHISASDAFSFYGSQMAILSLLAFTGAITLLN